MERCWWRNGYSNVTILYKKFIHYLNEIFRCSSCAFAIGFRSSQSWIEQNGDDWPPKSRSNRLPPKLREGWPNPRKVLPRIQACWIMAWNQDQQLYGRPILRRGSSRKSRTIIQSRFRYRIIKPLGSLKGMQTLSRLLFTQHLRQVQVKYLQGGRICKIQFIYFRTSESNMDQDQSRDTGDKTVSTSED